MPKPNRVQPIAPEVPAGMVLVPALELALHERLRSAISLLHLHGVITDEEHDRLEARWRDQHAPPREPATSKVVPRRTRRA